MTSDLPLRPDTEEWQSAQRRVELFDEAALAYDRHRGGYPDELLDALVSLLPADGTILEIGAGTGIATLPLARRGRRVRALEPGDAMRAIAAAKLGPYENVELIASTFGDWQAPPATVDVIFAADAWHWVDQETGPAKAARLLRPHGHLAVAWHVRRDLRPVAFANELERLCERASPVGREWLRRAADDGAVFLTRIAATDAFAPVARRDFPVPVTFSPDAFAGELGTFSWVLAMPPEVRGELLGEVRRLVEHQPGGVVHRSDVNVLYSAQRNA